MRGLALALVLAPRVAEAWSCRSFPTIEANFDRATVVAELLVLDVQWTSPEPESHYAAEAQVLRIWKGQEHVVHAKGRPTILFEGESEDMFGFQVALGQMYILYLSRKHAGGPLAVHGLCSGNIRPGNERGYNRVVDTLGPGWLPTPTGWVEGPGCASCATTEPTSLDAFWFGLLLLLRPRRSPNALSFPSTTTYPSSRQFAGTRQLRSRASRSRGRHP